MITFDEALKTVLNPEVQLSTEKVDLRQSTGRVLARNVLSDINMPPFNKAAMDGFAIRKSDINNDLTIIETIAAGQTPTKRVGPGLASKIMTGAPVPDGADFVIQVELSEMVTNDTVRFSGHKKNNIIHLSEDVSKGDVVLKKGQVVDARHIAVMASVGCTMPEVYTKPIIGVISTGNEIVEPQQKPDTSQIRNSNGHQLIAQVLQCQSTAKYFGIAKDTYSDTFNAIKNAIDSCDILLLTGGVSMGEFDFVPQIMRDLGIKIHFDRVAVQPGKPTTFGTFGNKYIFGLPGNPVSSFVQFEILVKPLIQKLLGYSGLAYTIKLPLEQDFSRKKSERRAFLPVTVNKQSKVQTISYHGSAHISALPNANGLAEIPEGVLHLKKGDLVDVRLF